jgi:hypothetical protein
LGLLATGLWDRATGVPEVTAGTSTPVEDEIWRPVGPTISLLPRFSLVGCCACCGERRLSVLLAPKEKYRSLSLDDVDQKLSDRDSVFVLLFRERVSSLESWDAAGREIPAATSRIRPKTVRLRRMRRTLLGARRKKHRRKYRRAASLRISKNRTILASLPVLLVTASLTSRESQRFHPLTAAAAAGGASRDIGGTGEKRQPP